MAPALVSDVMTASGTSIENTTVKNDKHRKEMLRLRKVCLVMHTVRVIQNTDLYQKSVSIIKMHKHKSFCSIQCVCSGEDKLHTPKCGLGKKAK